MDENSSSFTNDRAFENAFVVYVEGIEVPVSNVSVRQEVGSLPQASIQFAPDPKLARLGMEDRVEVQVFYKDNFYPAYQGKQPDFRLLYDGTLEGWAYAHNAFGRNMSFNSSHSSKILQDTPMFFLMGLDAAVKLVTSPGTQSGSITLATSSLVMPWSLLFLGLTPDRKDILKRPYDLVNNFFRASLSSDPDNKNPAVINAAFLTRLFRRRGLQYQFIPSPILEFENVQGGEFQIFPLLQNARAEAIVGAVGNGVQRLGSNMNLWDIFTHVFSQMYYEIGTILAPPIAQVDYNERSKNCGLVIGEPKWKEFDIKVVEKVVDSDGIFYPWDDKTKPNFLINHVTKPQWMFGIAPACNVIFPSMIEELTFSESYANQPTRCYVDNTEVFDLFKAGDSRLTEVGKMRGAYPPFVDRLYQKSKLKEFGIAEKNLLVWPAEFFRGPQSSTVQSPPILMDMKKDALNSLTWEQMTAKQALDLINSRVQSINTLALQQAENAGGSQQEILANLTKKLFDETQVLIDELKKSKVISGDITDIRSLKDKLQLATDTKSIAMDQTIRRFAQYEFFRQGAGARSGSVRMAFNPYIVPGFPTVIFNSEEDGNHFVGYVVSVEHQLSATSMNTSVSFVMGQTLDEFVQNIFDAQIGNNANVTDGMSAFVDDIAAAPAQPINVLRELTQKQENAETYFSRVFHQARKYPKKSTTSTTSVTSKTSSNEISPIDTAESTVSAQTRAKVYTTTVAEVKVTEQVKAAAFDIFRALEFEIAGDPKSYSMDDVMAETAYRAYRNKSATIQKQFKDDFDRDFNAALDTIKAQMRLIGWSGPEFDAAMEAQALDLKIRFEETSYQKILVKFLQQPRKNPPNPILDRYTAIGPSSAFAPMFKSYEAAMRYVARPACTLEEYIKFRGPWGLAVNTIAPDDQKQGKGAVFYERILTFKEGPGDPPKFSQKDNIPVDPLPKDLPETRMAWSTRLLNYRNLFLYGKVPLNGKDQT
jgi:hypothetical protein